MQNAPDPSSIASTAAGDAARGGWLYRSLALFRKFTYDVLVAHFPTLIVAGIPVLGVYGWQVSEGNLPGPDIFRPQPQAPVVDAPSRPEGFGSVELINADTPAGRQAARLHISVLARLTEPEPPLAAAHLRYRLSGLDSAAGGRSRVSLDWMVAPAGATGWTPCPPVELRFANDAALATAIADRLNNAINGSRIAGRVTCN